MDRRRNVYVTKPQKHGNKWRVTVTDRSGPPDGQRARLSFESEASADAYRDERLAAEGSETVSMALDRYMEHKREAKRKDLTLTTLRNSIVRLLPFLPSQVSEVTPSRASSAYRELAKTCAVDTHHNTLRDARSMWRWLGGRNPWDAVRPIGARAKGKDQLTIDESRRFLSACLEEGHRGAIASALCLCLALRIGEVVALRGRDIDDDARVLWVWRGKTARARRALEIPDVLRDALGSLATRAGSDGLLFPYTRNWVAYWTVEMCQAANVRRVTPHGLRGTHSTIATLAGATAHVVAGALGHAGPAVTRDHYIAPGAEDALLASRLGNRLVRSRPTVAQPSQHGETTGRN